MATPNSAIKKIRTRLPFILKALIFVVLSFGCLSAVRLEQALQNATFYNQVSGQPLSLYLALSGAAWLMVAIATGIGLWLYKGWAFWLCGIGTGLFTLWFWLERLLLHRNMASLSNWLFDAIFNLVMVLFIYSTLFAAYPVGKRAEDETNG